MWIAEKSRQRQRPESMAVVGQVTLPGDPVGVCLDGERRDLPMFAPGGYAWRPGQGEQVLVLKTGVQGEALCVVGAYGQKKELEEGEVLLYSDKSAIHLMRDGTVNVTGTLTVNGRTVMTMG